MRGEHLNDTLFSGHFLGLKLAAALYVLAIPLTHLTLPESWIWPLALFFLLAMLPPYPIAAVLQRGHVTSELLVSIMLALSGILGLLFAPVLLIIAIFGHGLWDLAKHNGWGTPFFRWYITGCVIVDWLYAGALSLYLMSNQGIFAFSS